jgi:hypothetical protein
MQGELKMESLRQRGGCRDGWWDRVLNRQPVQPRKARVATPTPIEPTPPADTFGWHDSSIELRSGLHIIELFDCDPAAFFFASAA